MDSRIREALEKIRTAEAYGGLGCAVHRLLKEAREALSILTADPEPCEDAHRLADGIVWDLLQTKGYGHQATKIAKLIDSYASRLVQEARTDERAIVEREVAAKLSDPAAVYVNALRGTIDVSEVRADERKRWTAILDRAMEFVRIYAKDNPKWTPVGMSEQDPHGVHALVAEISALLQGTEPAQGSEDVDMIEDAALIGEAIKSLYHWSSGQAMTTFTQRTDVGLNALVALDRLVARLKEGNRG